MLKRDTEPLPKMTAEQDAAFEQAVAEEAAAKDENVAAARELAPELIAEAQFRIDVVRQLRQARESAGVSLSELETRTGIQKSALSRLENSKSPNPTLSTLRRYANAVGVELQVSIDSASDDQKA